MNLACRVRTRVRYSVRIRTTFGVRASLEFQCFCWMKYSAIMFSGAKCPLFEIGDV